MEHRKAAIKLRAGRAVESLRALTHDEAQGVRSKLGAGASLDGHRSLGLGRARGGHMDRPPLDGTDRPQRLRSLKRPRARYAVHMLARLSPQATEVRHGTQAV
jgi:hypothetical protein